MTDNLIYKITKKGRAEAAAGSSKLSPSVRKLLASIGDRSTFAEIWTTVPQVMEGNLRGVLQKLVTRGFLETVYSDMTASDLDITRFFNRAVVEPTIQQKRQAEQQTIMGMRSLKQAGYFVNIVNRSGKRIPPHSGDKHIALIVDADESHTMVMARALLLAGFDTRAAVKRNEIIAELNRQPPVDVIAMDVTLPDVIGLELLGRLRAHPVYKEVPIIVMTTKVEHDDIVAALAYGATGYMTKPFKPEALLESVKAVLGLR
jgi:two-component system chemotaxis response regulator CheY